MLLHMGDRATNLDPNIMIDNMVRLIKNVTFRLDAPQLTRWI